MKPALTKHRIERALNATSELFEVTRPKIAGRCRQQVAVEARQAFYAAVYAACMTTFIELGSVLGQDHTTVLYHVRKAEDRMACDMDYEAAVRLIREVCC